jgi:hypothetical protein
MIPLHLYDVVMPCHITHNITMLLHKMLVYRFILLPHTSSHFIVVVNTLNLSTLSFYSSHV